MARFTRAEMASLLQDGLHELLGVGKRSRKRWRARGIHLGRVTDSDQDGVFFYEVLGVRYRVEVHKPQGQS